MPVADHFPTLWDPGDLFAHLALWAGAPAIAVAVVVWLLGIYSSTKSWYELGKSAATGTQGVLVRVRQNARGRTSAQQRALARLFLYAVFTVAFSYVLAEIVYVIVQMAELDPTTPFSVSFLRATTVAVTPWPSPVVLTVILEVAGIGLLGVSQIAELPRLEKLVTFLSGVARVIAWTGTVALALFTVGGMTGSLFTGNQGLSADVPMSFVLTGAITGVLCLGLALSLTKVRKASAIALKRGGRVRPGLEHIAP